MTREEAIKRLKEIDIRDALQEDYDALYMAIEALEQERSRLAQITQYRNDCEKLMQENEQLKKALKQEPCEDVISREPFTNSTICEGFSCDECSFNRKDKGGCILEERVMNLPSAKQEPKTGHWKIIPCGNNHGEYRPNKYACSECGWTIDLCRGLQQDTGHRLFCEHCGARMEGET